MRLRCVRVTVAAGFPVHFWHHVSPLMRPRCMCDAFMFPITTLIDGKVMRTLSTSVMQGKGKHKHVKGDTKLEQHWIDSTRKC